VDSQPKPQRSGREKTKCKDTVSNPNYLTGFGWK
jgi:ribosomal protein S14